MTNEYTPTATEADMRARWLPTAEARKMAAAAVRAAAKGRGHDVTAMVPMAQPGKVRGWWTIGQEVETVPGMILVAWAGVGDAPADLMDYGKARNVAEEAARAHLAGREGTTGYAVVDADGEAAVFEGIL